MNLSISFQQKDAAKAVFRAAGIPLTWNATAKTWQTSASELPADLAQYAPKVGDPVPTAGQWFYLAIGAGNVDFPYQTVFSADSIEALLEQVNKETYHHDWFSLQIVRANKRIRDGKSLPAGIITGHGGYLINALRASKLAERRALAERLAAQADDDADEFAYRITH